jgi:acetyl esterase/lipase
LIGRPRAPRLAALASLVLSIPLLLAGLFIWVPAPTDTLLAFSVGAPELSPWLAALALLAIVLAAPGARAARRRWTGPLIVAITASLPPVSVLFRIPGAVAGADAAIERIGPAARAALPRAVRASLDLPAIDMGTLFTGRHDEAVDVTRHVTFAVRRDGPLTVDIYRAPEARDWPVVLQLYGGAWQRGGPGDDAGLSAALASSGYVVVAADYRHAPTWRWPAQIDDVRAALDWVGAHAREYGGDPDRVALLGRSSGSQLAMIAALTAETSNVRAVVTLYGPVDLTDGYRHPPVPDTLDQRQIERDLIGGTPDDRPDAYREASPITYAGAAHPPALIIAAGRDRIVHPRYSAALHARLRESGSSTLLVIPWADHAFDIVDFGPAAQIALHATRRFLAGTLWR